MPFAPGGSVDLISRLIAPKMGELLGQQIIVDNRADASGNIGSEMLARAAPEGYLLLMSTLPFVVNPNIFPRVPYHPIKKRITMMMSRAHRSPGDGRIHHSFRRSVFFSDRRACKPCPASAPPNIRRS